MPKLSDHPIGWARPWAIAKPFSLPTPRSGAWYPIMGDADPERVVLIIRGKRVAVARRLLEMRNDRPDAFTVVVRSKNDTNPAVGTEQDVGRRYAVCPSCSSRLPLYHDSPYMTCGTCGHRGEVAYWETG